MKMLPDTLSFEMLATADDYKDPQEFVGWLRLKSTLIRERGAKKPRAVETAPQPPKFEQPMTYKYEEQPEQEEPKAMEDEKLSAFCPCRR